MGCLLLEELYSGIKISEVGTGTAVDKESEVFVNRIESYYDSGHSKQLQF